MLKNLKMTEYVRRRFKEMNSRRIKSSLLLRWFAAVTLLIWVGSLVLCQAHCAFNACGDSEGVSCHAGNFSDSHHGDEHSSQPDHHDDTDSACLSLKSAFQSNNASTPVQPEFHPLYKLASIVYSLTATALEPASSFSRQAQPRNWAFTPEVCLGPAFRSLAPPVLL